MRGMLVRVASLSFCVLVHFVDLHFQTPFDKCDVQFCCLPHRKPLETSIFLFHFQLPQTCIKTKEPFASTLELHELMTSTRLPLPLLLLLAVVVALVHFPRAAMAQPVADYIGEYMPDVDTLRLDPPAEDQESKCDSPCKRHSDCAEDKVPGGCKWCHDRRCQSTDQFCNKCATDADCTPHCPHCYVPHAAAAHHKNDDATTFHPDDVGDTGHVNIDEQPDDGEVGHARQDGHCRLHRVHHL